MSTQQDIHTKFFQDAVFVHTSHQQFSGIVIVSSLITGLCVFLVNYHGSLSVNAISILYISLGLHISSLSYATGLMILLPAIFEKERNYDDIPRNFNFIGRLLYIYSVIGTFLFYTALVYDSNNVACFIGWVISTIAAIHTGVKALSLKKVNTFF